MPKARTTAQMAVLDVISAHIAVLDGRGVIASVNEAWRQFADANTLQATGHGIGLNYLEACDRAGGNDSSQARQVAAGIRSVLAGATKNFSLEYPCHSPTEERWFQLTVTPLPDDQPDRAVVVHVNITERKAAEDALKALSRQTERRERMLSSMLSSISDFAYIFDRDGRILFANQSLLDLWGLPLEAAVGRNVHDLGYPPELAERLQAQVQQVFETGERLMDETPYVSPSGLPGYYEYIFSPSLAAGGGVDFGVGFTRDITERKLAECAMRKQKEFLAVLIENVTEGIVACNADGVITLFNRAARELHGRSAEPIPAERWAEHFDLYLPDGQTRMTTEQVPLYRALREGAVRDSEMVIAPKHRPARRVVSNGQVLYDVAGLKTGAVVAMRDITEERRAEESIRMQAHMLDNIGKGVIATDLRGRITYANRFAEKLYGWAAAELVGRNVFEVTVPQTGRGQAQQAMAQLERGENWQGEFLVSRRDGTDFLAHVTNTGLWDRNGRLAGIVGISEDISERKQAEAVLRQQHAMLSNAQRVGRMGFWELDLQHDRLIWSDETYRLFGIAAVDFDHTFEAFLALVHPDDAQWMRPLYKHPAPDSSVTELEYRICRPDGQQRIVFERGEITRDAEGRPLRKSGVVMDITERRKDQDALRQLNAELEARVLMRTAQLSTARVEADQANHAKSAFLAAMSHEIRTPMNGVIGMLDVLHETSLKSQQMEMVDLIRDSAFSLLTIIDDILDFSKMEVGKMVLTNEPMRLGETIEKSCGMLIQMAVKRNVRVTLFIDPEIPDTVCGDEGRLRQVLVNLIGNAIKFSSGREQPGRVSVRALLAERQAAAAVVVDLVVADNGIGINEAAQAQLFTPFSQADASTTRRFGGTGLGLAISGMLVHLMKGRISVLSAPGQGSTFTVRLHFTTPQPPASDDAAGWHVRGLRCCIVGGEQALADDFGAYLRHAGALVQHVQHLAAAAAAAHAAGLTVWLILPGQSVPPSAELRAMAPAGPMMETRFVILQYGARRKPRVDEPGLVTIDADALTRRTLFEALALAAGRVPQEPGGGERSGAESVRAPELPGHAVQRQDQLILVAEDNETNRTVIRHQLQMLGFTAEFCVNGREALERWRSGSFALLLTDLHMPEMDGYELAAAVRASETGSRRMPIIALTANALKSDTDRCWDVGMNDVLIKPVKLATLKAMLSKFLPDASVTSAPLDAHGSQNSQMASEPVAAAADLDVLIALIGDDPAAIDEVLRAFRVSAEQASGDLKLSAQTGSLRVASETAHRLKSGASALGATRLAKVCAAIEAGAEAGGVAAFCELLPRFEAELRAVYRFLDSIPSRTQ